MRANVKVINVANRGYKQLPNLGFSISGHAPSECKRAARDTFVRKWTGEYRVVGSALAGRKEILLYVIRGGTKANAVELR